MAMEDDIAMIFLLQANDPVIKLTHQFIRRSVNAYRKNRFFQAG